MIVRNLGLLLFSVLFTFHPMNRFQLGLLLLVAFTTAGIGAEPLSSVQGYSKWSHGPPSDSNFFPIAVWLQSPANAPRYKSAGINTYVGLWKGPTEDQLAMLKQAGMRLICNQNAVGLKHLDDPTIIGWMHGDEPDNAQSLGSGKGYGPPISPEKIIEDYKRIAAADPSRPVVLNLGQGVAWDKYYGRGVRTNHPEDYAEYIKGSDIVSFDIYPVVHERAEVAGKLWFVPQGVDRLIEWSGGQKVVWNCLECTHISNPDRKATPQQLRAEAWMSLIHGSRGLIYFVHEFKPQFREAALLQDPEMLRAATALNQQITALAPVLNSPPVSGAVKVSSENSEVPVDIAVRKFQDHHYIFAAAMREGTTSASFEMPGVAGRDVEVIGEDRTLKISGNSFKDNFSAWEVHLYRVPPAK